MGKINESVCEKNLCQQKSRKTKAIIIFSKNISGNLLGASFWWSPMGKKDTYFGGKVTDMTKGRKHGLSTETLVGRQIYKG